MRDYQAYASGASPPGPGQISSSLRSVSSDKVTSRARWLVASCAAVRGPTIVAVTTGLCNSQARATSAGCSPSSAHSASYASAGVGTVRRRPGPPASRGDCPHPAPSAARRRAARRPAGSTGSARDRSTAMRGSPRARRCERKTGDQDGAEKYAAGQQPPDVAPREVKPMTKQPLSRSLAQRGALGSIRHPSLAGVRLRRSGPGRAHLGDGISVRLGAWLRSPRTRPASRDG